MQIDMKSLALCSVNHEALGKSQQIQATQEKQKR